MNCSARNRLILAAAFLSIGAAVTIAIAWTAVARGSLQVLEGQIVRPPSASPDVPGSAWLAPVHIDWPWPVPADWPPLKTHNQSHTFGLFWEEGTDNDNRNWNAKTYVAGGVRAGWPWKSLYWTRCNILEGRIETWTTVPHGIDCPPSWSDLTGFGTINGFVPRRLPITPIWHAFIADTLLYSLASAALILGPIAALRTHRRSKRRRAGKCITCGYPLHGTTCPECGSTTTANLPTSLAPGALSSNSCDSTC